MKRLSLLLFIFLCLSLNVFSQRGTVIGVNGSFNSTWILWSNAYGITEFKNTKTAYYQPSYGYDAAFAIGQNFVDVLGLRAEVGTTVLNQRYDNPDAKTKRDLQLKYIQVPVFIRLASPGQNFKVHLMFGPQFDFLSAATQKNISINNIDASNAIILDSKLHPVDYFKTENIKDRYNSMDLLGVIDLGFDISLSDKLLLNLGIRLHGSLKDINKTDWQFKDNPDLDYYASRNVYGGVNVGLTYAFKNWYKMK